MHSTLSHTQAWHCQHRPNFGCDSIKFRPYSARFYPNPIAIQSGSDQIPTVIRPDFDCNPIVIQLDSDHDPTMIRPNFHCDPIGFQPRSAWISTMIQSKFNHDPNKIWLESSRKLTGLGRNPTASGHGIGDYNSVRFRSKFQSDYGRNSVEL